MLQLLLRSCAVVYKFIYSVNIAKIYSLVLTLYLRTNSIHWFVR